MTCEESPTTVSGTAHARARLREQPTPRGRSSALAVSLSALCLLLSAFGSSGQFSDLPVPGKEPSPAAPGPSAIPPSSGKTGQPPLTPSAATSIPGVISSASASASNSLPSTLSGYLPDDKYKLRPGDKVGFQIIEDRDTPRSLVVADSGELDIPYIGRVTAGGKTCKELCAEVSSRLEKEYYHRATVIIALDQASKYLGRVYVLGQVRNQGPIDIAVNEKITAGRAILRAGGFGDFANKKKVKIVRGGDGDASAAKESFELNMVLILEQGKTELDLPLQPDDFVIVPSRLINF